jgi:hypothetical protein
MVDVRQHRDPIRRHPGDPQVVHGDERTYPAADADERLVPDLDPGLGDHPVGPDRLLQQPRRQLAGRAGIPGSH